MWAEGVQLLSPHPTLMAFPKNNKSKIKAATELKNFQPAYFHAFSELLGSRQRREIHKVNGSSLEAGLFSMFALSIMLVSVGLDCYGGSP